LVGCSDDETADATTSSSSGTGASGATGSGGSPAGSGGSGTTGGESSSSQGSGGGVTGGAGGAGGGMGIDAACGDCLEAQGDCEDAGQQCENDAQCGPWLGCVEECADNDWSSACIDACDTAFPNAGALKTAVTTCFCGACGNVCGPFCA